LRIRSIVITCSLALTLALIASAIFMNTHIQQKLPTTTTGEKVTSSIMKKYATVVNYLELTVLVDNYSYNKTLVTAWGLSIYCVADNVTFLFDTGPDDYALCRNSELLGINLSSIDFVVLSHEHGDHVGGLNYVAKLRRGIKVYVPSSSRDLISYVSSLGLNPVPVHNTVTVAKGVFIVGEVYGPPYEIAVAINTSKGFVVVVGCSHAGVTTFLRKVSEEFGGRIYAVIGGFHLFSAPKDLVVDVAEEIVDMGARKIYPIHCSGDYIRHYLAVNYPAIYGDGGVGMRVVVEGSGGSEKEE